MRRLANHRPASENKEGTQETHGGHPEVAFVRERDQVRIEEYHARRNEKKRGSENDLNIWGVSPFRSSRVSII